MAVKGELSLSSALFSNVQHRVLAFIFEPSTSHLILNYDQDHRMIETPSMCSDTSVALDAD